MNKVLNHAIVTEEFLSLFSQTANDKIRIYLETEKYTSYVSLTFEGDQLPYEYLYIDITDSDTIQLRVKQPCDGFRCIQGVGKTERVVAKYLVGEYLNYKRKQLEDLQVKVTKLKDILGGCTNETN